MLMTIEPTLEQRKQFQNLPRGQLALVQFVSLNDISTFMQYNLASERTVEAQAGHRTHSVYIDQYLAGGQMHYQAITVDLFPSSEAALIAFDAVSTKRQATLKDIYSLAVRPVARLTRIVKGFRFLAPLLSRMLGTASEKEMTGFAELANPEKGPVPVTLADLREHDQTTPFYMMNLNKYYPEARYKNGRGISGEQAYNRYSAHIMPYLISVGGYPDILGHIVGTFVGDEGSPLHDDWSDFAMVYYPSRENFIKMMTNAPKKGAHHRDAGLQRAVLMPSSDIHCVEN